MYFNSARLIGVDGESNNAGEALQDAYDAQLNPFQISSTYLDVSNSSNRAALLAGAPFNADGVSKAPIFYSVFDLNNTYFVYNYNIFYGCACLRHNDSLSFCTSQAQGEVC